MLKYLGDSSKDVFMVCYINPSFSEIADSSHKTLKYHIPCTMANEKIRRLSEGTYCLEIVKKFGEELKNKELIIFLDKQEDNKEIEYIEGK